MLGWDEDKDVGEPKTRKDVKEMEMGCSYKPICKDYDRAEQVLRLIDRKYLTVDELHKATDIGDNILYKLLRKMNGLNILDIKKRIYTSFSKSKFRSYTIVTAKEYKKKR